MDSIIESRELQIERKLFSIDLRENGRGRFLRITEDSQGHRNVIIVPMSGVDDFADAIDDVLASEPTNRHLLVRPKASESWIGRARLRQAGQCAAQDRHPSPAQRESRPTVSRLTTIEDAPSALTLRPRALVCASCPVRPIAFPFSCPQKPKRPAPNPAQKSKPKLKAKSARRSALRLLFW